MFTARVCVEEVNQNDNETEENQNKKVNFSSHSSAASSCCDWRKIAMPPTASPPSRRRASRPAGATAAAPVDTKAVEEEYAASALPAFEIEDESAAAGAPSPDADAAVSELFSTVLRWDFDGLVARGGAAEASSEDPKARQQLKHLPLTFKNANVSGRRRKTEERGR